MQLLLTVSMPHFNCTRRSFRALFTFTFLCEAAPDLSISQQVSVSNDDVRVTSIFCRSLLRYYPCNCVHEAHKFCASCVGWYESLDEHKFSHLISLKSV